LLDTVGRLRLAAALTDIRWRPARAPRRNGRPWKASMRRTRSGRRTRAGIAAHLHLSESSAGKHVNAIFTKLGLTTEDLSRRRVTAVLAFLRDAGLRG
jgi:hypothetical protein